MFNPSKQNLRIAEMNFPQVTKADDGKVLGVWDGKFCLGEDEVSPPAEAGDNGKFLGIDGGKVKWLPLPETPSETALITLDAYSANALSQLIEECVNNSYDSEANLYCENAISTDVFDAIAAALADGKRVLMAVPIYSVATMYFTPTNYTFVASDGSLAAVTFDASQGLEDSGTFFAAHVTLSFWGTTAVSRVIGYTADEFTPTPLEESEET